MNVPTASLGTNLTIGMALNIIRGRQDMLLGLEMPVLGFDMEKLDIPRRPTCSNQAATD